VKPAAAASLWLLALAGCSSGGARPIDAAISHDVGPSEPAPLLPGGPTACGCTVDQEGTLNLFWSCYCAQSFADCAATLSVPADCASRIRRDYPACGFTVITTVTDTGNQVPSVYDASGNLVGRIAHSDLSGYTCPSDPSMISDVERAGQFPSSSCAGVVCDPCYAGPFPCALPDASSSD
jgi:hypothetical protein